MDSVCATVPSKSTEPRSDVEGEGLCVLLRVMDAVSDAVCEALCVTLGVPDRVRVPEPLCVPVGELVLI